MTEPLRLTLPRWFDAHAHLRQGPATKTFIRQQLESGVASILAMPNTKPPVSQLLLPSSENGLSLIDYRHKLFEADAGAFEHLITPLYLTAGTTPEMIEEGARLGLLRACKYYPPGGTTNSDSAAPMDHYMANGVLAAMEANGVILNVHGEAHGLPPERWYDPYRGNAESIFYYEVMGRLIQKFPNLKIVCEHVSTQDAVNFVRFAGDNVGATVCPQHLMWTMGDLVFHMATDLKCMPVVKGKDDRAELRMAITASDNVRFFAGTDNAPHPRGAKLKLSGCACGCLTAPYAPALYAMAFEAAGVHLATEEGAGCFRRFMVENGSAFYGIPVSQKTFTLERVEGAVLPSFRADDGQDYDVLPPSLGLTALPWRVVA